MSIIYPCGTYRQKATGPTAEASGVRLRGPVRNTERTSLPTPPTEAAWVRAPATLDPAVTTIVDRAWSAVAPEGSLETVVEGATLGADPEGPARPRPGDAGR